MFAILSRKDATVNFKGQRFYSIYKAPGLEKDIPFNDLMRGITIALEVDGKQRFTFFKGPTEFATWALQNVHRDAFIFEELCQGERFRKPVLDIECEDMQVNAQELEAEILDALLKTLEAKDVNISIEQDLWIATSHREKKYSWRIIVDGHFHRDSYDARAFALQVAEHVRPEWRVFIDKGVYSDKHRLRLINCRKFEGNTYFRLKENFMLRGALVQHKFPEVPESSEHKTIMEFQAMLITFVNGCKPLPIYGEAPLEKKYDDADISEDMVKEAYEMVKFNLRELWCYKKASTQGGMILLQRTRPEMCKLCNKKHESENAFITFSVGGNREVLFYCRRAKESGLKPLSVGFLKKEEEISTLEGLMAALRGEEVPPKVEEILVLEEEEIVLSDEPVPVQLPRPGPASVSRAFAFPCAKPSSKLRISKKEQEKESFFSNLIDKALEKS